jgi:DNA repair protein RecO (recombination protein O)
MLNKTNGIVIKTTKYSESSLIALIYTKSHGMITFLIQGVYSKRAVIKPSLLQPLQLLEMNFYYKESRNLNKLKDLKAEPILNDLHFNINKSSIALVISELIYKSIKEEETNEELFDFLFNSIILLDKTDDNNKIFLIVFMIQMTKYLGFYPTNNYNSRNKFFNLEIGAFTNLPGTETMTLSPPDSDFFGSIIDLSLDNCDQYNTTIKTRQNIVNKLVNYYKIHVSNFNTLNSYKVLSQVFNN